MLRLAAVCWMFSDAVAFTTIPVFSFMWECGCIFIFISGCGETAALVPGSALVANDSGMANAKYYEGERSRGLHDLLHSVVRVFCSLCFEPSALNCRKAQCQYAWRNPTVTLPSDYDFVMLFVFA